MRKSIYILLLPLTGCFGDSRFSEDNPKIEFSDVSEIRLITYCAPVDTCYTDYTKYIVQYFELLFCYIGITIV